MIFLLEIRIQPIRTKRWVNTIGNITENELIRYNTMIKIIKEVNLQEIQFKVNNHILVTKSYLQKLIR